MGLFGRSKANREEDEDREELRNGILDAMNEYGDEEIDGPTYVQKILELGESYQKKRKK